MPADQPTSRLHRLSLDSLKHLCQGRLAEQAEAVFGQIEALAENLDAFQTKSGTARARVTITLDLGVSADGMEIEANCEPKMPKRKALRDSARRTADGFKVLEECLTQEDLPLWQAVPKNERKAK